MDVLISIAVFIAMAVLMVVAGLTASRLLRPNRPSSEKQSVYECGEPAIGTSWVQFDLRFYIVALFFLVFDVEVALIYPWALLFRENPGAMLLIGAPFIGLVAVGFAYEWLAGSLEWVRSTASTTAARKAPPSPRTSPLSAILHHEARRDPESAFDDAAATPR